MKIDQIENMKHFYWIFHNIFKWGSGKTLHTLTDCVTAYLFILFYFFGGGGVASWYLNLATSYRTVPCIQSILEEPDQRFLCSFFVLLQLINYASESKRMIREAGIDTGIETRTGTGTGKMGFYTMQECSDCMGLDRDRDQDQKI